MKIAVIVVLVAILAVVSFGVLEQHQTVSRQDAAITAEKVAHLNECTQAFQHAAGGSTEVIHFAMQCNLEDANGAFDGLPNLATYKAAVHEFNTAVR